MKKLIVLLFSLYSFSAASEIVFYNYSTMNVGPGIVHKKIIAPLVPWTINVLEIDLTNPYNHMQTIKANNNIVGQERTSSMAERTDADDHKVIGAVNGDFYGTGGVPLTTQVLDGQILKNPYSSWYSLSFSDEDLPDIAHVAFSGKLITKTGTTSISGINQERGTDQLILFNSYYGSSTGTNEWGDEFLINPISGWVVNDTTICVVEQIGAGNMSIPTGKAVLSGNGVSEIFIADNINVGDTVKVITNLLPSVERLVQSIGGNNKLLENGVYTGGTNTDIHPRTAAGFNADSTILYLMTIDGRQESSRGMSYREVADFMKSIGADHVLNLDGGGSTTMVVRGDVENSPSDVAGERTVANSLMAISTAPVGELAHIQINPDNKRIFLKNTIDFITTGWDDNYNPLSISKSEIEYTVSPSLGTIDSDGLFTATDQIDSGYVYVSYNGLKDSAYIYIKSIKSVALTPESVVTDTITTVQFSASPLDVDNLTPSILSSEYTWASLNPEVGSISETGVFKGIAEGTAKIEVSYLDAKDTAEVVVQIGEDTVVLDSLDSVSNWTISGDVYDEQATTIALVDSPKTIGKGALHAFYQFTRNADSRSWVFLNTDIPVYGLPDSIFIDIKSDMKKHIADIVISDDNEELFSASTGIFNKTSTEYETYKIPTTDFAQVEPGSRFNYPICLKAIKIKLGYEGLVGDLNQGNLYFDNLRAVYPNVTTSIPLNKSQFPKTIKLNQNYPNPFNPKTTIEFETVANGHVSLIVYDMLGREVAKLVDRDLNLGYHKVTWNAQKFSSGQYVYVLKTDNIELSKKLILLK